MSDDRQRKIERRANEIWQREGRPDGRANEHWRLATAEIEAEEAAAVRPASAAAKPQPAPEEAAKPAAKAAPKRGTKSRSASAGAKAETAKAEEPKKTVRKKK